MDETRLLIITEAARRLGVEQKTLRRWTDAGKVACVRTVGGQRRYERAEIERMRRQMGFKEAVGDDKITPADHFRLGSSI